MTKDSNSPHATYIAVCPSDGVRLQLTFTANPGATLPEWPADLPRIFTCISCGSEITPRQVSDAEAAEIGRDDDDPQETNS